MVGGAGLRGARPTAAHQRLPGCPLTACATPAGQRRTRLPAAWHTLTLQANGKVDALQCSSVASGGNTRAVCARVGAGAPPSHARPFETAYTKAYDAATMHRRGVLVYRPAADVFCTITQQDRPVECLLHCANDCAGKLGSHCP